MLFNIMISCAVLMILIHAGYWWTQPSNPWRGPYTGLSLILAITWILWELIQLGAIKA
jgi:hypothetical protein